MGKQKAISHSLFWLSILALLATNIWMWVTPNVTSAPVSAWLIMLDIVAIIALAIGGGMIGMARSRSTKVWGHVVLWLGVAVLLVVHVYLLFTSPTGRVWLDVYALVVAVLSVMSLS